MSTCFERFRGEADIRRRGIENEALEEAWRGCHAVASIRVVAGTRARNDRDVPSTTIRLRKFMPMMMLGTGDAVRTLV